MLTASVTPTSLHPVATRLTPSVAPEVLRRDAVRIGVAGQAQHGAERGRVEVSAAAIVLGTPPSRSDCHYLERDEPAFLEVIARMAEQVQLHAALVRTGMIHIAKPADRPRPLVNGTGRALQKERGHVPLDPRDPGGQACLVHGGGREG